MGADDPRHTEVLVHLTTPQAWASALACGWLAPSSLSTEGFVHLCRPDQLAGVVDRYYRHLSAAVVLLVDPAGLDGDVRWEPGPTGEHFPHLYGELPTSAVRGTARFSPAAGDDPPTLAQTDDGYS